MSESERKVRIKGRGRIMHSCEIPVFGVLLLMPNRRWRSCLRTVSVLFFSWSSVAEKSGNLNFSSTSNM